ncbi:MAG: tRNA (guanosine(46)-N7)-methyltransferase TrmB [Steroidobacteraceae bacterium]
MSDLEHARSIRSFVTRAGRITPAQQRALDDLWPKYGVPPAPDEAPGAAGLGAPLELGALFGRDAPRTLEIGFGNGENLAALAGAHPEHDYLGVEVHRPGIGRLLRTLEERHLGNVRVLCQDAVELLGERIAPGSLREILILFPDPWPKKRHHKRRLVQPPFVACAARALETGGMLRLATDWQPYAVEMLAVLNAAQGLANLAPDGGFLPRPAERPPTRFEVRGTRLGHGVWELGFRRL